MLVVIVIAAIVVIAAVVLVAKGRGDGLSAERIDYLELDLGPVSATDVALLRPPTGLWGYNMQATDEAMEQIAESIRERDVRIVALEQLVTDLSREPGHLLSSPYISARHRRTSLDSARPDPYPVGAEPYPVGAEPYPVGAEPYPVGAEPYPVGAVPYPLRTEPYPLRAEPYSAGTDPYLVETESAAAAAWPAEPGGPVDDGGAGGVGASAPPEQSHD